MSVPVHICLSRCTQDSECLLSAYHGLCLSMILYIHLGPQFLRNCIFWLVLANLTCISIYVVICMSVTIAINANTSVSSAMSWASLGTLSHYIFV